MSEEVKLPSANNFPPALQDHTHDPSQTGFDKFSKGVKNFFGKAGVAFRDMGKSGKEKG